MSITIEDIKSAGEIPESFNNISPGRAIFYVSNNGIETLIKERIVKVFDQCKTQRDDFSLEIKVEATTNIFLENCIVARRLNIGSLYKYNLLIARLNCDASADAFVKEFFNLHSSNDEALKFINKKKDRSHYKEYDEPSFTSGGMLQMIIMRPHEEEDTSDVNETEKSPEQIADENEILQMVLAYADKYKQDVPLDKLRPLANGRYVITDDINDYKLVFTKERGFWLKAGTMVKLNFTRLQRSLYLLLLAHPEGIKAKSLSEHREELISYHYHMFKGVMSDEKVYKEVDNLVKIKDQGDKFKMDALEQLCSRLNKQVNLSISNHTNQLPFIVQKTNGVLHIDLPRKFFECEDITMKFEIK